MKDLNCVLSGSLRLLSPLLLLIFWHKKTNARLLPALLAFFVCIPVFFIGGGIRSSFSHDNALSYYIQQALLFGILEEGAKYLMLRYYAADNYGRNGAVTYGIGHGSYESIGSGLSCFALIGTGRAAPGIFINAVWSETEGALFCISLTVLLYYGITHGRSGLVLPAVILLHALSNVIGGIFYYYELIGVTLRTLLTAAVCYAAYRCWKAME